MFELEVTIVLNVATAMFQSRLSITGVGEQVQLESKVQ